MARKAAKKPEDLAAKAAAAASPVVETAGEVVEIANGGDAEPARSMADDLEEIVGRHKASPRAIIEGALRALEYEAENHPQGRQGCMIFDRLRVLPFEARELIEPGVWRAYPESLWQFWIEAGANFDLGPETVLVVVKAIRADMIHLREAPENVRGLAV